MLRPSMIFAQLRVAAVRDVTPRMRRITFDGAAGFAPVAPDQQVKLFFARDGGTPRVPEPEPDGDTGRWYQRYLAVPEPERPWMRTYSVRRHLPGRDQLEIDFALHGADGTAGPATRWAASARPGGVVALYGPAVSHFRPPVDPAWRLLVGDETALPAIGAQLEALDPAVPVTVLVEVADAAEEQRFDTGASVAVRWLHRRDAPPRPGLLLDALRAVALPDGPGHAWVAGEASTVRAVRRHLVDERGMPRRAVAFAGYWRLRLAQDDAPTDDDAADQAEVLADSVDSVGGVR